MNISCYHTVVLWNWALNPELYFVSTKCQRGQFQWQCDLRHVSVTTHLLWLRVWILPGARMSVCCECCVLSGRGLCDGLITCPEESYCLVCLRWGLHESTSYATCQWVWLPGSEQAASKLDLPLTFRNEKAEHSDGSASVHHLRSQRWTEDF